MIFKTLKEVLDKARAEHYAVGAFNVNDMEIAKAIGSAAKEEKSPVILAVSPSAIKYAGIEYIYEIARVTADKSGVPTVLHLDHGTDFKDCVQCIRYGWSSVMYDGSKLPFQENVAMTKKIVEFAHAAGVSVEAELGKLAGVEGHVSVSEKDAIFTNPEEAKLFVEQTGVDALAVAIGTSHGAFKFKGEANLDFERLAKIEKLVNIPIVLHGASGVPKEVLDKAAKYGAKLPGRGRRPQRLDQEGHRPGRRQDQHRHRHPAGADRGHPAGARREAGRVRPAEALRPGRGVHEGRGEEQDAAVRQLRQSVKEG